MIDEKDETKKNRKLKNATKWLFLIGLEKFFCPLAVNESLQEVKLHVSLHTKAHNILINHLKNY